MLWGEGRISLLAKIWKISFPVFLVLTEDDLSWWDAFICVWFSHVTRIIKVVVVIKKGLYFDTIITFYSEVVTSATVFCIVCMWQSSLDTVKYITVFKLDLWYFYRKMCLHKISALAPYLKLETCSQGYSDFLFYRLVLFTFCSTTKKLNRIIKQDCRLAKS